jgi:flagellar biosynthetic protein FlhB
MAEKPDKESKTEEPTEKKVRDSYERGFVPFSREAAMLASLLGMLIITGFFLVSGVDRLNLSLRRLIDNPGGWSLESGADVIRLFEAVTFDAAHLLLPVALILAVSGILASMLQNAPRIVLERIRPQFSRLSLSSGWRRLFGAQGLTEFAKALFKLVSVVVLGFLLLRSAQHDAMNAMIVEPMALPALVLSLGTRLLSAIAVACVVLVAADIVWSRLFWHRELKMTRQEVKDELKQADGDPIVKARMRSLARDRMRKRMIAAVPRATLVIANPTHFAVALRYVREEGGAPLVVAKGQDLIALKIRAVAVEHGIPVVENKALAQALYRSAEVDRMIPPEFYKAVAEIVFFLFARQAQTRPLG